MPTIIPRRPAGNAVVRIVRLRGRTIAPPRPCTVRAAISSEAFGASAQAAEATVNRATVSGLLTAIRVPPQWVQADIRRRVRFVERRPS
jgi:hypothetical protein